MLYVDLLNKHRKVHKAAEEQPYQCGYCGRGFSSKFGMYDHFVSHVNEEPFRCGWNLCTKRCKDASKFNLIYFNYLLIVLFLYYDFIMLVFDINSNSILLCCFLLCFYSSTVSSCYQMSWSLLLV